MPSIVSLRNAGFRYSARDFARHVIAGRRDQVDLPAALDELREVAAMAVDAGCVRGGCVLIHAEQTPGPNRLLWLNPFRRAGSRQNRSQVGSLAAAATRPLQRQSTEQQQTAHGGNPRQTEPSERQRAATVPVGPPTEPGPHDDPWAHLSESADATEESTSATVATVARTNRILFTSTFSSSRNQYNHFSRAGPQANAHRGSRTANPPKG